MKRKLGILATLVLTISLALGCRQPASTSVGALTRTSTELVLIEDCSEALGDIFASPDLRRITYTVKVGDDWPIASVGGKMFVVLDGQEGKQYDEVVGWKYEYGILIRYIVFDSSDSFRYDARQGDKVYLVKETIR